MEPNTYARDGVYYWANDHFPWASRSLLRPPCHVSFRRVTWLSAVILRRPSSAGLLSRRQFSTNIVWSVTQCLSDQPESDFAEIWMQ